MHTHNGYSVTNYHYNVNPTCLKDMVVFSLPWRSECLRMCVLYLSIIITWGLVMQIFWALQQYLLNQKLRMGPRKDVLKTIQVILVHLKF
jgi:hypothetical protein